MLPLELAVAGATFREYVTELIPDELYVCNSADCAGLPGRLGSREEALDHLALLHPVSYYRVVKASPPPTLEDLQALLKQRECERGLEEESRRHPDNPTRHHCRGHRTTHRVSACHVDRP